MLDFCGYLARNAPRRHRFHIIPAYIPAYNSAECHLPHTFLPPRLIAPRPVLIIFMQILSELGTSTVQVVFA